jgi:hypothetical protein
MLPGMPSAPCGFLADAACLDHGAAGIMRRTLGASTMRRTCGGVPLAVLLLPMAITACQEPGQPGPMERTGTYIDRSINDAQRGMADFSQRAGQSLDQAGRSIGAGAQRMGTTVHDNLMPATDTTDPSPAAASGSQSLVSTSQDYSAGSLPKPTPMAP